jgi:gamma-glutamylcyclotransferase (GGCT)/AIG2-like uncharacterized protein YtfP
MFPKILGKGSSEREADFTCDKFFVYGTLMNLHAVRDMWCVEPAKIEKATMKGDIYSAGSQPIMLEGKGTVHGLLLTILELASSPGIFDKYEACHGNSPDSFHHRILREATTESGQKTRAWVFVGNPKHRTVMKTCVEKNRIIEGRWAVQPNRLHGPLD